MQDIIEFLNSKETFKKVCLKLATYDTKKEIGDIARKGFISGGSVSNIIISMLHGGEPVINDIDVYQETKDNSSKEEWYPTTYIDEDGLEIVNDSYGRIFVSEDGARMKVTGHRRKGIFNIISYVYENYRKIGVTTVADKNLVILQGFDLNCCKSGLDLENEKIVYTSEFVEFLKTKQLKVVHPCAPIQTTIRIYRKMKDLDCYCNVDHEMRFLTVAYKNVQSGQMSKYVGPETYEKYEKCKEFVDKYFTLREPKNSEEIPYSLREKYYIGNKRNPEVRIWLFDSVMDFNIIEDVSTINKLKRVWQLLYTFKRGSEQDKINKIFYKNVFLGKKSEDSWSRFEYPKIGTLPLGESLPGKEIPYYNSTRYTFRMILTKSDYHKCNFDLKHVDYIDNFTNEHYGLQMFLKNCNTLMEQYELVRFIKSLVNKEGQWVIGALENSNLDLITTRDDNNKLFMNIIGKDVIIKLVEKYKKENTGNLTEPIDLSDFEYKDCVRELVTKLELQNEGNKMGHCVGGYSRSIIEGISRIFHVDCDGIGSTVEIGLPLTKYGYPKYQEIIEVYQPESLTNKCVVICKDENINTVSINEVVYKVRQHSGRYPEKGNRPPTETNEEIVKELVRYLNINHLPKNFKIRSESFANKEDSSIFV